MAKTGKTTLTEVARQSGTSAMAVSVVLNGARSNTRVSDATRSRIMAVASELNYSPNAMAQGLKRQRNNTLGVLFSWAGPSTVHSPFSIAVLDGIVAGAAEEGFHILLYTEHWKNAALSSRTFSDSRSDGVILVAPDENSDAVAGFMAMDIPVILLSSATNIPGIDFVHLDNKYGVSLALDHLWELGHRRIAYIGYGHTRYSIRQRFDAYCEWLTLHNLPIEDACIVKEMDAHDLAPRLEQLGEWMRQPHLPTAVFATTDDVAAEVLEAARLANIAVPQELSVVGFDDVLVASLTTPKLTTVHHPISEMGKQAAHLLVRCIKSRRGGTQKHEGHVAMPHLVVRDSTASVFTKGDRL